MENENKYGENKSEIVFSKKFRAGKRRTYFFDVKTTRTNDYYLTITESKKRIDGDGYERHKVFLYKEDINRFLESLTETINHVKTELLPEYDFDEFRRKQEEWERQQAENINNPSVNPPVKDNIADVPPPKQTPDFDEEKKKEKPQSDDDLKW